MSGIASSPDIHIANQNIRQSNFARNLVLLGLVGVGVKILLILALTLIKFYYFPTNATTSTAFSLSALQILELDLSEYLLTFGVTVAFAYKYGYVLLNQRNIALCVFAVLTSATVLQLAFSHGLLEILNLHSEVEGYINRPSFSIKIDHHGDLQSALGYTPRGQFYSVAMMLLSIVIIQAIFKYCAKTNFYNENIPPQQTRFIMLLAYACVLRSLFPTITEPAYSLALPSIDQHYIDMGSLTWMYYVDAIPSILFLPSIWVCYVFGARYFPKDKITEKRNTVSYAFATIVIFGFLFIAALIIMGIIFSIFERHALLDSKITFSSIFGLACLIWIYVRIRSIMVCLLLLAATTIPFILSYTAIAESVFFDTAFTHDTLFIFPANYISMELLFWLVYSKAIQYGIHFMLKPRKTRKPISIQKIYKAIFKATENEHPY